MTVDVVWDDCYLNEESSKGRKKQVVRDLFEILHEGKSYPSELVTVYLEDHSLAFEQFIVVVRSGNKYYKVQYYGGGS